MDTLRWILLIVGILVIAGIYGAYKLQDWRRERPRAGGRDGGVSERDIDGALENLDSLVVDEFDEQTGPEVEPVDLTIEADERPSAPASREPAAAREPERLDEEPEIAPEPGPESPAPVGGEKIVVIGVGAPEGRMFSGREVAEAAQAAGLRHGEHDIFHRTVAAENGPVAMFSMANILEPGNFDPNHLDEIETPGVVFFLQLPSIFDGLIAFEQMLEAARDVARSLRGHLLDERRCDLSAQAIEHIREELREYRRLAHLAARQRRARG